MVLGLEEEREQKTEEGERSRESSMNIDMIVLGSILELNGYNEEMTGM